MVMLDYACFILTMHCFNAQRCLPRLSWYIVALINYTQPNLVSFPPIVLTLMPLALGPLNLQVQLMPRRGKYYHVHHI
jgi:hypothetical protein